MARSQESHAQEAAAEAPAGLDLAGSGSAEGAAVASWGDELPAFVRNTSWLAWLQRLSGEERVALGFSVLAALLFIPWLGATGFWDPWEPHYGEVAREMIARGDYIHPWWESGYFFSKPALDLWLMAAGMLAANTNGPERYLGVYTEWCVRLPYAIIASTGAVLMFIAASRLLGRRAAVLGTLALLTSPLMVFLARQAVPDPVFVGLLSSAMACLLIVLFDKNQEESRDGWCIAFYCFVGLATLSKGLLGFALPGAVALLYCVTTGEWFRLRKLRLGLGCLIVLAICGPWYGTMFAFDGRDDEGKTFFERFIIHDHFKRLVEGVHTTTPGGSFVYFIEQLGFDIFPWVFAMPGAATVLSRVTARPQTVRERALFFLLLWVLIGFAVFAFSATKFHHYCFPILAPLLFLGALWLERVLDEGLRAHAGELFAGGVIYGLVAHDLAMTPKHFTDMFVYNYDRPYPEKETDPRQIFTLLFYAAPAVALSPWIFDRLAQLTRLVRALFDRRGRVALNREVQARVAGAPLETVEATQDRVVVTLSLVGLALVLAIFLGWFQWRRLSPHWTQRDLFWEYYHQSTPDEPIGAYLMNWRGETFYSRNTVRQLKDGPQLQNFLNGPGERKWVLVEPGRLPGLRQLVSSNGHLKVIDARNNKFVLTVVEQAPAQAQPATPGSQREPGVAAPVQTPSGSTPSPGSFGAPP